ncbi:MAG: TauD/TfdA family dioxygenase [Pseudomonadales bacterium]|nr:TauD/TfdA family dioxygenase [Pseudomonadales bacterium]
MNVRPVTPTLGAEVQGLDLTATLSDDTAAELRALLARHQVLFFRSQPLDAPTQLALAHVFGEPMPDPHPKFGCVAGLPAVSLIVNDADNPPDINVWHTDTTYRDPPAGTCVLHCVQTPPDGGGNTLWSSMYAAWEALSPGMRTLLEPLTAWHQLPLDGYPPELIATVIDKPIVARHPVVRWVEEAGRPALFVNRVYTHHIEGLSRIESRAILAALFEIAESPDRSVRFAWNAGDTAIWDNRCTQHFAVADYQGARRVMHRVAVTGEPVVAYRGQDRCGAPA